MIVKLLTEHHLEFLSLKGCCTGSPESTLVKIPHCWKSHVMAHIVYIFHSSLFILWCMLSMTSTRDTHVQAHCVLLLPFSVMPCVCLRVCDCGIS